MLRTVLLLSAASIVSAIGQQSTVDAAGLQRHYVQGKVIHYLMMGDNDGWKYSLRATDTVRRDVKGRFFEEISWSDLTTNARQTLNPSSLALRQTVSLDDPVSYMKVPDLAHVQPLLIGPITDMLTFYGDLLLAIQAKLARPGQTAYIPRTLPNSWADGQQFLVAEDAVDFQLKVQSSSSSDGTVTLLIQHVPPPALHVAQPASWMQENGMVTPNNFVQVSRQNGGFVTETGKETFNVRLVLDAHDGHIISARMHNPVVLRVRNCSDKELSACGPETSRTIVRDIELKQVS